MKSVILTVTSVAMALTLGLASPASARLVVTVDVPSISNGDSVTFSSDLTSGMYTLFKNDQPALNGSWLGDPLTFRWSDFTPCAPFDLTLRLYDRPYTGVESNAWLDPYDGYATVEVLGDNSVPCDSTYGPGESDEPLAKTGSDASAVAELTGFAVVAALAVAGAAALRSRRAQH